MAGQFWNLQPETAAPTQHEMPCSPWRSRTDRWRGERHARTRTPCRARQDQGARLARSKPEGLTGLPTPIISKLVDGLMDMARTHIDKRSRLVSAAVGLAYQNGFEATSLADIAREAKVPLGNVYYYFKTKDEIGEAIVEMRLAQLSAQRQRWDEAE